jgi:hypothetical protein
MAIALEQGNKTKEAARKVRAPSQLRRMRGYPLEKMNNAHPVGRCAR